MGRTGLAGLRGGVQEHVAPVASGPGADHPKRSPAGSPRKSPTSAALGADPETQDLEPGLNSVNQRLGAAVSARNEAQRQVNIHAAKRDYAFHAMIRVIETFERKASAAFSSGEKDAGYRRLFPQSPAQLSRTTLEDRERVFPTFVERLADEETPAELAKPAAEVARKWKEAFAAAKAHAASITAIAKARDKESAAKEANLIALRKVEAKLLDRFAADRKRARTYFPAGPKAPPKKNGAAVVPAAGAVAQA